MPEWVEWGVYWFSSGVEAEGSGSCMIFLPLRLKFRSKLPGAVPSLFLMGLCGLSPGLILKDALFCVLLA